MIGRDGEQDVDAYGFAPWIVGILVAAALIGTMFALAKGFA